jgi:hypothetical protein
MGWGTEIDTGMISASPPPDSPAQGTRSPALNPGSQAPRTAEFLADAFTGTGNSGALAEFITDLRYGQHSQIRDTSSYGVAIRPLGRGIYVVRRHEPHP